MQRAVCNCKRKREGCDVRVLNIVILPPDGALAGVRLAPPRPRAFSRIVFCSVVMHLPWSYQRLKLSPPAVPLPLPPSRCRSRGADVRLSLRDDDE